jgi:hypothetical protein
MRVVLNVFCNENPSIALAFPDAAAVCDEVGLSIVGCGSVGLTLATQLAAFTDIPVMVTDLKY